MAPAPPPVVDEIDLEETEPEEAQLLGVLVEPTPPPPQQSQQQRQQRQTPSFDVPDRRPTLADVPPLDRPLEATEADFQQVWRSTQTFLNQQGPPPPGPQGTSTWTQGVLRPWVARRMSELQAAIHQAEGLERSSALNDVVPPALAGMMYLDMVAALWQVPRPPEIQRRPELEGTYHEMLWNAVEPILRQSQAAFQVCSQRAAQAGPRWTDWQAYCSAHAGSQ